jgi:replicative DNA helicase
MSSENISTGYTSLDHSLGGFKRGELVLVAARPAMGKTSLLINLAERIKKQAQVLFISLELSAHHARRRFGLPLNYLDDTTEFNVEYLREKIIASKADVIFIDYLQLLTWDRKEKIRSLKMLARDLNVCFVLSAQLGRDCELRTDKRPLPDDLNYGYFAEINSLFIDNYLLLFNPSYYQKRAETSQQVIIELNCWSSRSPIGGTVFLKIDRNSGTVSE